MYPRLLLSLSALALFWGCSDNPNDDEEQISSSSVSSSSIEASSSSAANLSYTAEEQALLIEDFEDGDTENMKTGYWYSFNDNDGGGASTLTPAEWEAGFVKTGGHESQGMFSVKADLVKAEYLYAPYVAIGTMLPKNETTNPANYGGLSYWHKGVAHTFRIDIPEVSDYDNHVIEVPAHTEWTLVTIDFTLLAQEGWGEPVALNLDQEVKIIWNLRKKSGDFAIDDVRYIKEIVYVKENNMELKEPLIPTALVPKGDVTTTLNNLSKKYLTKGLNFTNWGEEGKISSSQLPADWKFNEASVKKQADQGMLGIRLPIDLDLYLVDREAVLKGTNTTVEVEPFLFAVLDSFNIWTKRYGLSYTIDYHAYDGTFNKAASKDPVYRRVVSALWKRIAEHYVSETREDLFFELTNEPNLSLPAGESIAQADWTSLAQMMIDSIRTVDATRPVIFGDTEWYSLDKLVLNTPFTDAYVIYAFHMYDPFIFTHQGASWSEMGTTKGVPFPYSTDRWSTEFRDFGVYPSAPAWVKTAYKNYYKEGNKTYIKNRLIKAKNWAFDHQVPLICNEWGAYNKSAKIEDLNAYFKTMGEIFQELDISWQVWFGIMDENYDLLPGMSDALDLKK